MFAGPEQTLLPHDDLNHEGHLNMKISIVT